MTCIHNFSKNEKTNNPILKVGKEFKQKWQGWQISKLSIRLVIRKMQIKATIRKTRIKTAIKMARMQNSWSPWHRGCWVQTVRSLWEMGSTFLINTHLHLTERPHLWVFPREMKTYVHTKPVPDAYNSFVHPQNNPNVLLLMSR